MAEEEAYVVPTSFAQQRLWFLNQLQPKSTAYNVPAAVRFTGTLNREALERCLSEIIRRHETLRTTFGVEDGQPVQIISPFPSAGRSLLKEIDLTRFVENERRATVLRLAHEDASRPFDISRGPLVRATLLRLSDTEHVLLFSMHHIVSDGWSMGVLLEEISKLYEAYVKGQESPLPELPIQYADYAAWQRQYLQGEVLEQQLAYWRGQLLGAPTLLNLPTDRQRPPVQTFKGAQEQFAIPQKLSDRLKAVALQEGATLFMMLVAAFNALLYRYTNQPDILIGTPIANRQRAEIQGLIGFFVNTLVIRSKMSDQMRFCELLAQVRRTSLDAFLHQDVPFEILVEQLRPPSVLSYNPLFQVMFLFQNTPRSALNLPGLTLSDLDVDSGGSKFDLSLSMIEMPHGLGGFVEYNVDLFEAATIKRMIGHFEKLLEGVARNLDYRLFDLPLLTDPERQQLIFEWNNTGRSYPQDRCVPQLVAEQAAKRPEAVAISDEQRELSYGELNRRANRLARSLRALGVGPEELVGICAIRSVEWVVGLLAILKAGGAYVSLDPTYPKERLDFMIEDARVRVLLTQRALSELSEHPAEVLYLDDYEGSDGADEQNGDPQATTENLAYVVYTSGSTGRPKAVVTTHGSLLNLVFWHHRVYNVTPADRATQVARMGFDASVWELWPYLTCGASVHLLDEETRMSAAKLRDWLITRKINIGFLPPVLAESILYEEWPPEVDLRALLTGSDKAVLYPPASLPFAYVNHYGPTEATVIVTSAVIGPQEKADGPPLIGRPLDNTQIYLLDRNLNLVPVRVPGELHIGGNHLARGYLNRPERTAEKFIPNPFDTEGGGRLYKTGDLARYRPDGQIEFLGRLDHQVKIRGYRIELGEVEALLCDHEAVESAVVILREDTPGNKQLVAYVVSTSVSGLELRAYLSEKLPEYMVPAAFVLLEKMPVTPNNKVDRDALPAPDVTRAHLDREFVPPQTELEQTIAELWQEALKVEKVSLHDNFFDLGAHSLIVVRVHNDLKQRLGREIPLIEIFKNASISELAKYLSGEQTTAQAALQAGAARGDVRRARRQARKAAKQSQS
ncbi:MAG TPA: amino acid adenylation domain-containing protein [Pyrinomonadaceae bacterium]|nr:amino acid adenylation domain-containing protein [Pyrinomonadaceae bacterium]